MRIQCVCQREFEVDISEAGKRFRCPHCGRYFTFPGTVLAAWRGRPLIATSQPPSSTEVVVAAAAERSSPLLLWAAVAITVTASMTAYLLLRILDDNLRSPLVDSSQVVTQSSSLPAASGEAAPASYPVGTSPPHSAINPALATDFYQNKAPIEMTTTEWLMTLRDWGELPPWWSQWPYKEDHPWSFALNYQADLFLEVSRMEQNGHVTDEQVQRLRKDFFNKRREYTPFAENSPHDLVDRYIKAARTSISRELMQQQLNEAAKYLRSMLLRPGGGNNAQANH